MEGAGVGRSRSALQCSSAAGAKLLSQASAMFLKPGMEQGLLTAESMMSVNNDASLVRMCSSMHLINSSFWVHKFKTSSRQVLTVSNRSGKVVFWNSSRRLLRRKATEDGTDRRSR